jgi:adenylate kinase family enzyme
MPANTSHAFSSATFARVNVVGASGSGKSTFSMRLAELLGHSRVELDALFWELNWRQSKDDVFFTRVEMALAQPTWVLDGNYDRTLPIKWANVTAVVWLDYSFTRTFLQSLKRALYRIITRQEIWPGTGNRESFARTFLSGDSILLWMLKTHGKVRARYEERMSDRQFERIAFYRIKSPAEAEMLLNSIREKKDRNEEGG